MNEDDTPTTCPGHPRVKTSLRCASCGEPICPGCLVHTPVGARCRSCASSAGVGVFLPGPFHLAATIAVALLAGAIAGWAVEFGVGIITLLLALAYGAFAGEMVLRVSGRKCGAKVELPVAVSMVVGAIGGRVIVGATILALPSQSLPPLGLLDVVVRLFSPDPTPAVALALAVVGAVGRIRYF